MSSGLRPPVSLATLQDLRLFSRWCEQQLLPSDPLTAFLLARANHTGTQLSSTISDFPTTVSQAEAEAGTEVIDRLWTAERVSQAIAALASGGTGSVNSAELHWWAGHG